MSCTVFHKLITTFVPLIVGTVKFIDYEYADFNYQAYDIGNHFNEFAGTNKTTIITITHIILYVMYVIYKYMTFTTVYLTHWSFIFEFWGVSNVDSSLYPSCELQFDWLTAYLESFKWFNGVDSTVNKKEVLELYVQVCKFSLVSILERPRKGARLTAVKLAKCKCQSGAGNVAWMYKMKPRNLNTQYCGLSQNVLEKIMRVAHNVHSW